jgi:hypothetical protein
MGLVDLFGGGFRSVDTPAVIALKFLQSSISREFTFNLTRIWAI